MLRFQVHNKVDLHKYYTWIKKYALSKIVKSNDFRR